MAVGPVPQQGWSRPPHSEQRPAAQVPPVGAMPDIAAPQLSPAPMHWPAKQHAPEAQVLPAQHGWLGPPQLTQLAPLQIDPVAEQTPAARPLNGSNDALASLAGAQQGSPMPPQRAQTLPRHAVPPAVHEGPAPQQV